MCGCANTNIMKNEEIIDRIKVLGREHLYAEPQDEEYSLTPVDSVLSGYFYDFDNWKDYDDELPIKITKTGLFALALTIVDHDLVAIDERGSVLIENSNVPEMAELLQMIVPQDILMKVADYIY